MAQARKARLPDLPATATGVTPQHRLPTLSSSVAAKPFPLQPLYPLVYAGTGDSCSKRGDTICLLQAQTFGA